jgi:hypothetical protein
MGILRSIAFAQPHPSDLVSVRSYSGQFVACAGRSATLAPELSSIATNRDFVQLEPTLATVSCERIRQLLLRELNSTAPWRGTVYLVLYPARTAGDSITIISDRFKNDWHYRVDLPNVVERQRYVRAIVQVLLFELANRRAQAHEAEIPLWLVEGFTQLLLASNETEIILPPPRGSDPSGVKISRTSVSTHMETLLQQAQKKLRGRPPLTFEALSWPADHELTGDTGDLYSGSAQLFVGELLRFQDGHACMGAMLAQLPQNYNWQFAFLGAFHTHFKRPLDVEKWWALSLTQASGRDAAQTWPIEESWQKLDQAVHTVVQARAGANELPLRAEVGLQKIIREWDPLKQSQTLRDTLRELGLLRLRIAQEYVGLAQDYFLVIETYLLQLDRNAPASPVTKRAGRKRAVEAAIQQLDALDAQRAALRPADKPVPPSQSPAPPTAAR